ncbi:MAG: hypothetical protein WCO96_06620 [Actinomycetes bacterium]
MIPIRDDLHSGSAPATALVIAGALLIGGVAVPGGSLWVGLLAAFGGYLYAPSLVRELGPLPAFGIAAVGAIAAGALAASQAAQPGPWAALAATFALIIVHLARHPRARMLALIALPYRASLGEMPSWVAALIWLALAALAVS